VNTLQGIAMNNPANTLSGNVTLNNNQTGNRTGEVSFSTVNSVTIAGSNMAAAAPNGNFIVRADGDITVATIGTVVGISQAVRVELLAETGVVNINATISVTSNGVGHDANAAVLIKAATLRGTIGPIITPGLSGEVCAYVFESLNYSVNNVAGERIHFHFPNDKHIVYRPGVNNPAGYTGIAPGTYMYIQADLNIGSPIPLNTTGIYNVYLIDIGNTANANTRTINSTTGTGFIEIRGAYQSSGTLNLNPAGAGAGTVRLVNSEATPASPAVLTLPSFTISDNDTLDLRGGTGASPARINTTGDIELGSITAVGNGINHLTLNSGGDINIAGTVGSTANAIGNFISNGTITFNGNVHANSYNHTGIANIDNANIITYGGTISVSGNTDVSRNVTLEARTTSGTINLSTVTGTGNITINNSGQYTQSADVTANSFTQTGNGAVSLSGNITATAAVRNNAVISFASAVGFTPAGGNLTLTVPDITGGLVRLASGTSGTFILTLVGGSSTAASLEFDQDNTGTIGNIIIFENSFVTVKSGKTITHNGNLTLQTGITRTTTLDTSAGSWHMGGNTGMANEFAGVSGTLTLGVVINTLTLDTGSRLIGGNLNLTGFSINNTPTGWATIAARGNVNISNTVNLGTNLPQLILEMSGSGTQSLTTAQPLGSLHVEPGSTTNLMQYTTITGEVQITWPGILNAGTFNIEMQAGLIEQKDGSPARVGRWRIIDAPQDITSGGSSHIMYAFKQADAGSVEFKRAVAGTVFFEIIGNTVWQKFICTEQGAVIQFSTHPDQHVFLDTFEVIGASGGTNNSNYVTLTRLSPVYIYDPNTVPPGGIGGPVDNSLPRVPASRNLKAESENEKSKFWNFNLVTPGHGTMMNIKYVTIYFSHAWNQRIPIDVESMNLNAIPFYRDGSPRIGYFNCDWVQVRKIIYSFVEDGNGNGKLDRIRVQTNVPMNGDFSRFNVEVEGYRVDRSRGNTDYKNGNYSPNGFDLVSNIVTASNKDQEQSSFYIYLEEPLLLYDGSTIRWWVTENNSLMDAITLTLPVGEPGTDEHYKTINTIPPRISYAITLPGLDQTFVRMSQPVTDTDTNNVTIIGSIGGVDDAREIDSIPSGTVQLEYFPFDEPVKPFYVTVPKSTLGYLLELGYEPTISELAVLPPIDDAAVYNFTMQGFTDRGVRALDWNDKEVDEDSYMYYPSPRYPVDWNYSGYLSYTGNSHIVEDPEKPIPLTPDLLPPDNPNRLTGIFLPPNRMLTPEMMRRLEEYAAGITVAKVTPSDFITNGEVKRRITDVLVSIPPTSTDSENYFAWPVWARYADISMLPGLNPGGDFWGQQNTDSGVIWAFDGTKFLEARDITLQARLNRDGLTNFNSLSLYFAADVPAEWRNPAQTGIRGRQSGGLWLPELSPSLSPNANSLFYIAPSKLVNTTGRLSFYPANHVTPSASSSSPLFIFDIPRTKSGVKLDFLFRLEGNITDPNIDPYLFVARLDAPAGANLRAIEWWKMIRPFSFDIQDIRLQRGGVTILNNVINSDAREIAHIRYHLVRPGRVTIQIYTLDGTLVKSIRRNEYREAGEWTDVWDGTNNGGRAVARGMYYVRVVAPDIDEIRNIMVVK